MRAKAQDRAIRKKAISASTPPGFVLRKMGGGTKD